MKLLLADQNRDVLLMYQALLSGRGNDVVSAFDGAQVADYLNEDRFDLMIVNYDIPRVRAAQLIRMAKDRQTPAIALVNGRQNTGIPAEEIAAEYVMFPFFPEDLFSKIDMMCTKQKADTQRDGVDHETG